MSDDSEDTLTGQSRTPSRRTFDELAGSVRALPGHEHKDLDEIIAEIREAYAGEMAQRFIEETELDPDSDVLPDDER